jgi:UDP-glucose-4-epimerase GalE
MLECGIDRLIFSSSCAIYGIPHSEVLDENHPQAPINPYGETKLFFERACHWYEQAHQLRSVCLRYFNAAGADPEGELGESHFPEPQLIPRAIGTALGVYPDLTVYGTDFPTPDGTAIRDYVHVSDVAAAHVIALRYLSEGGESVRLNLGTGNGSSVRQVIRAVEHISNRSIRMKDAARRPGDPGVLVACSDRARAILGWSPRFSEIRSIISTAWEWTLSQSAHSSQAVVAGCTA